MNKKRLSAAAGVLFVLLIFLQLQTFAANQSLKLISSVSESKDNVVRTYTYNSNGLLGSHKYQQIGWNTFTYNYKYNELGELIWERDGDTKNTLTFVYDDDGRVLKKIKNDDTSGATVVSWFGNTCASYGKVQYTSNAAGQILTSSSYAHLFVNNKEYGDTEVYTFSYDGNGNICESKWEFPDLQTRYYTFAMTYQDGVITKASDSTHDYQYTIEYTLVSVPEEFVNLVKAQQKILLHTLNYSAPIVMREFQFASAGNLVKPENVPDKAAETEKTESDNKNQEASENSTFEAGKISYTISNNAATVAASKSKTATKVNIPATVKINGKSVPVTSIAPNAFKGMKNLTSVAIGKNVKKIGKNAFNGCKRLKKITIKTTKLTAKSVGSNTFKGISKKAVFKCPKSKKAAYKKILLKKGAKKTMTFK